MFIDSHMDKSRIVFCMNSYELIVPRNIILNCIFSRDYQVISHCFGPSMMPGFFGQYWFRLWLGAVRPQAMTWANVAPCLCRIFASLGDNELINISWPKQDGGCLDKRLFQTNFLNDNVLVYISPKVVPDGPIDKNDW